MSALARLRSLVRNLASPGRVDRQLDEEIGHALDVLIDEKMAGGLDRADARRAALVELGGTAVVKERVRAERTGWRIAETIGDMRFGLRLLRRDLAFSVASVVTLGLGVGATTAIFSVVSGLVLRPLPFADADRLVQMRGSSAAAPRGDAVSNLPRYRDASASFDGIVAYDSAAGFLRGAGGTERIMTVRAEHGFFDLLGVPPLGGRTFTEADGPDVAVISEAFWRRQLSADPAAIGGRLTLDGRPLTVVGVMPEAFQFPYGAASVMAGTVTQARTDVWRPFDRPVTRARNVTARLKDGVSRTAAEAELRAITRRLEAELPDTHAGRGVYLEPLGDVVVAPAVRRVLFMLFGAVGLLMVLAAANVMNLSLVRAASRSREIAVRTALGAGRRRLVRQFLTEGLVLSLIGGLVGLGLGWFGAAELVRLAAGEIPRAHEVGFDWRVFLFLAAVCTLAGMVVGVAQATFAGRRGVQAALQSSSSRTTMNAAQRRLRDALVVAEVALAFMLAVGAAVLVRELVRLRTTDLGLAPSNVVTLHLGQPGRTAEIDPRRFEEMAARVATLPGVAAAGFAQLLPLQNWGWTSNSSDFFVNGRPPASPAFPIHLRYVTQGYFDALGIAIDRGRAFTANDTAASAPVVLVNGTLARRYFPGEDPVGQPTNRGTIVGVVRDFRQVNADQPPFPELYFPVAQNWSQVSELGMTLIVRTTGRPDLLIGAIRASVHDLDPSLAIFNVKTMDQVVGESLSAFTLYLYLMAAFAAVAVILALSGTYGVVAFIANARTREFAIRAALGATRGHVTRLVVAQGLALAAAGLAVGVAGALAAAPLVRGLPVAVRPPDAATMAPIAFAIAVVALIACLVPAWRAERVNPMQALRNE